jgi:IclR family acetate operon transcriptional repressor
MTAKELLGKGLPEESGTSPYSIRAVERTLDILDVLREADDGVGLGKLSQVIGLPKSSTFRYLATLEAGGHVIRDAAETFRLSPSAAPARPRDVSLLRSIARPWMEELARRFDETINLAVLDRTKVAYVDSVESSHAVRFAARPGHCDFVHSSALGKALASRLAPEEIRRILAAEGMPAVASRTITDLPRFLDEIEAVKRRGYSVNDLENDEAGRCVATAIPGSPLAAIGLSAPAARFPVAKAAEVGAALRRAAGQIAGEFTRAGI